MRRSMYALTSIMIALGLALGSLTAAPTPPVAAQSTTTSFTNATPIAIPPVPAGKSSHYPWTSTVSGVEGAITQVKVRLLGLTHSFPDDIDILLVSPGGQRQAIVLSDVGGSTAVNNVTLTLADDAPALLPDNGPLTSGTYRPTNADGAGDTFAAPAPNGPYGSTLAVFNGLVDGGVNGAWSLYVMDNGDAAPAGSRAGL